MVALVYRLGLTLVATAALVACGGGGGGGSSSGGGGASSMTVTPSLGKFSSGTSVRLKKIDGTVISSGTIGTSGSATLDLNGHSGPVIVEVVGSATAKYFDEGTGTEESFAAGQVLRAALSAPVAVVGVTSLTNAVVTKLEAAAGGIAGASPTAINDANAKVAVAFNLPDVLAAPTPVGSTSGTKLNIATVGDKYALVLAALAKTAGTGQKATDIATALAQDMKDDKLDGQDASGSSPISIANAPTATAISTQYSAAATIFADATSQTSIAAKPLPVTTDVASVSAQTGTDLAKAKALFSELRTTIKSFTNVEKTGFLDTQAQRATDDINASVAPRVERVIARLQALGNAKKMFEDAENYSGNNTFGLVVGVTPPVINGDPANNGSALTRATGTWADVWYGTGSGGFQYCWTGSSTGLGGKVTCAATNKESIVNKAYDVNTGVHTGTAKMLAYELTINNATGEFSYTAKRYNVPLTVTNGAVQPGMPVLVAGVPQGSGTFRSAGNASNSEFTLNGTMPPSATDGQGNVVTTVDDIYMYGTSSTSAIGLPTGHTRYMIKGDISTADKLDASKFVRISVNTGTYIDVDDANSTPSSKHVVVAHLMGTVATAKTAFTGTLDLKDWANYANATDWHPTSVVVNGSITDKTTGGAGEFLVGKVEAVETDFATFDSHQPQSTGNYTKGSYSFTGTVKAPSRPVLSLVIAVERTGFSTKTATVTYSYDTKSITGTGTANDDNPSSNTMTLSNQDGVQYVTKTGIVSKSGTTLATVSNSEVNYIDGTTASLQ